MEGVGNKYQEADGFPGSPRRREGGWGKPGLCVEDPASPPHPLQVPELAKQPRRGRAGSAFLRVEFHLGRRGLDPNKEGSGVRPGRVPLGKPAWMEAIKSASVGSRCVSNRQG